jgi:hypothetical protein
MKSQSKFFDKWTPRLILEVKNTWKQDGFKGVVKKFGWKLIAAFFVYYLIRDICLYLLLPWYLAKTLV